jgi:hypothetical protein
MAYLQTGVAVHEHGRKILGIEEIVQMDAGFSHLFKFNVVDARDGGERLGGVNVQRDERRNQFVTRLV